MQKLKCACSSKLSLNPLSFKLHTVSDYFGSAAHVKHSLMKWKLELAGKVSEKVLKLQLKSSYTVLINTGQAPLACHHFENQPFLQWEEMQGQPSAEIVGLIAPLVKQAITLPILSTKNLLLVLVSFMCCAAQEALSISVLIVILASQGMFQQCNCVTYSTATSRRSHAL